MQQLHQPLPLRPNSAVHRAVYTGAPQGAFQHRGDNREVVRSTREKSAGCGRRASLQQVRANDQPWEAPAWAKPSAAIAPGNSVSSRPARASSTQDLVSELDRAVQLLQAAFSEDQVAALASAPVWHFSTSVASVRAMAGAMPVNQDAQCLRTALDALSVDSNAGRQLRYNLLHRAPAEVAVDFQALQAELGAFIAAAASLNLSQTKKPAAPRQSVPKSREGVASSADESRLFQRKAGVQGMGMAGMARGPPSSRRTIPEGIQSAGGRPSIPGAIKAQSGPSSPEDNSPLANGLMLPGSCLVSPGALTRKKERPGPDANPKAKRNEEPKLRKVPKNEVSQSDSATPPSEVASTAVPRASSTICSEGSFSDRHPPGVGPPDGRSEAQRGPSHGEPLRWPDSPATASGISARRRELSAEAPVRCQSARPVGTGRVPSHPSHPSYPSRPAEDKAPSIKKDREGLLKSLAAHFQNGQPGQSNVNSLDFYAVGRLLGKGAFGKVNVAVHKLTEELSAMKQCDRRRMNEVGSKKCFLQEVAIMKRLTGHANVIQLFEVVETPSQIVLVMEFASGGDLLKYVRTRRRLAEPCAKDLFKQLLEGLDHIHKKLVVHRDIKLENLLLDPFGCVKIADFGVAAVVQPEKKLHDHCGTPSYIAPEILQDAGYDGFPVDVWSSGIALYAMLCGRLPFKGKSMSELKRCILRGRYQCPEHLSAAAQQVIASMLILEPRSRATVKILLSHNFLQGVQSRAKEIYGRLLCPKPLEDGKAEGRVDILQNDMTRAVLHKAGEYGFSSASTEDSVTEGKFDHATATFHLLAQQVVRARAQNMQLNVESSSGDPRPHADDDCEAHEDLDGGTDDVSTLIQAAPC